MSCTEEQLHQYLKHINYPKEKHASEPLRLLEELQACQLSTVPFESTALHYSKHRLLSLDLDDLFQKIVIDGKGGYCMELNTFFGAVLRGLGFTLINIGARVKNGDRYGSWGHMANLVTIDDKRYLVDVGFGADGPMRPVPLQNGYEYLVLPRQLGKLEYRSLAQHTDPNQRIWVYSIQDIAIAEWRECYCFTDLEYFPEDFVAMNLSPMTRPTSFFVKTVLAMRAIIDEQTSIATGIITLYKDTIKRKYMGEVEVLETLQNETQRIKALERYFGIVLKPSEQKAIRGLPTELIEQ